MLEFETALERILRAVPNPGGEIIPTGDANHRIVAETIRSAIDLPVFDNSSMDGYAVRSEDVTRAMSESPVRLRIVGKAAAGDVWGGELKAGESVRLFTGSPLPRGGDAVVMQEDTRPTNTNEVEILEPAKPWENVRLQGEDVKRNSILFKAGKKITAGAIGLLAAAGTAQVRVGKRPTVGLLATGSELIEPDGALSPGKIYESNRTMLAALVAGAGGLAKIFPLVADTLDGTRSALSSALNECDILITSGGVSVGELDFIKPAIEEIGGSLYFWKVAIKPGRPFVFGRAQGKLLFGLPGNPVSAIITFLLLVRPAILRWQGATEVNLPRHRGTLKENLVNQGDRRHFMRVKMDDQGGIHSAGVQGSHILSSLASANGLVDVPPRTILQQGTDIPVLRWE